MNMQMAYLLGMISGNGEIRRDSTHTRYTIEIPHKKLKTENLNDVRIYVKASLADIRSVLEPLIGANLEFTQLNNVTLLSFEKKNEDYISREIMRYIGSGTSHNTIRLNREIFDFTFDERISFLRGFADVTGYIRRSNYFFEKYKHRVYLEVPHNWYLVIDVCNLLKSVNIPVQNIDWAHPNTRDPKARKFNEGKVNFWKKEHQIKIFANEFEKIGFGVLHKNEALNEFSYELKEGFRAQGKDVIAETQRYYWEGRDVNKKNPHHPGIDDTFIPTEIRGKHYNSWKNIARDLGYNEQS